MKKAISILVLLVTIIFSSIFIYVKLSANGEGDNYFNVNLRQKISRYEWARSIFGLHYDGDGRYEYLGNKNNSVVITVASMSGLKADKYVVEMFSRKIEEVLGKSTRYTFLNESISFKKM